MLDLPTAYNLDASGNSEDDSYSFFDAFRQSLEEKLNERFTVEELRQQCKSHIESKPVDPLCSSEVSTNASSDINDKIEKENPDLDETIIGSNEEWGSLEVEGRILCKIHAVTLHVVEKQLEDGEENWTYQIIKRATGNNIDQDKRAIHIIKLGVSHFLPIFCNRKRSRLDSDNDSSHSDNDSSHSDIDSSHSDNDGDVRNDNSLSYPGVSSTFPASESINPENPPELDQKSKRFTRINVPENSDCLFLSFILAYLIPVLDDDHVFEERFSRICGVNPENTHAKCGSVKNLLKSFNPFLSMSSTYDDKMFLWLVKLFRERVIEHLKKIPDSLRAGNFDSSCSDKELKAIERLMGCEIHATHSGESGDSHGACDASIIELVYDTKPSGEKYYNFYVPKEFGEKFAVYRRLDQFVRSFVVQLTVKLRNFRNQLLPGGKTKVDDPCMMVGAVGQAIGGVVTFTAGMGFTGAPAGKELANSSINLYYEKKERKLAKNIIKIFEPYLADYARFKGMLVKVAGEIFRSFECQFCKFTDHSGVQRAMDKLAEDAIIRMLNYINKRTFQDDKIKICLGLITKGVILGKSKSKLKNGRTIIDDSGKEHRTTDIFERTGLFISDGGMEKYYSPIKVGGACKYGYRLPFDWENKEKWLNFHYSKLSIRVQRYHYLIDSSDEYNRKLKDVLDDFNSERVPVNTEDVQNVHESIKGQNIILDGLVTISKKQDIHFNLSTERLKCMQGELQSIAADIGKMRNTTLMTDGELEKFQDSFDALIGIIANLSNTISEGKISSNEWLSIRVEEIYADLKTAIKESAEAHSTNAEARPVEDVIAPYVEDEMTEKVCLQDMQQQTTEAGIGNWSMADRKISEAITVMNNLLLAVHIRLPLSHESSSIIINTIAFEEQEKCSRTGTVSFEMVSPDPYKIIPRKKVTEPCIDNTHKYLLKEEYIEKIKFNDEDLSEIFAAGKSGRWDDLIQKGISETGMTAGLYFGAQNGFNGIVEFLLGINNLQVRNVDGNTPLHVATYNNHLDVVKTLLNHGATVNAKNAKGLSPIFYAVQNGSVDIFKVLLKCKHLTSDDSSVPEAGATLLHYAAQNGHEKIVALLVRNRIVNCNVQTIGLGMTPLHLAVLNHREKVVDILLKTNNIHIDLGDINLETPLHYAAKMGNVEIVRNLLNEGAAVDAKSAFGDTPLSHSISYKNEKVEQILNATLQFLSIQTTYDTQDILSRGAVINAKDDDGATVLHFAASCGSSESFKCILKRIEETNPSELLTFVNAKTHIRELTAMAIAASENNLPVVQLLIDYGADLNIRDVFGQTSLHHAVSERNFEVAMILLNGGAGVNAESASGDTPYSICHDDDDKLREVLNATLQLLSVKKSNVIAIEHILKRGAVINAKDDSGATVLHYAAVNDNTDIVECILKRMKATNPSEIQTFVNTKTFSDEVTALMIATEKNRLKIVELLMEYEADPNIRDWKKETALHYAVKAGKVGIVQILLNGAVINTKNQNGWTVLHHAVSNGSTDTVECILRGMKETNPSELQTFLDATTFGDEVTALMIATEKNRLRIVELLMDYGADPNIRDKSKEISLHYSAKMGDVEIATILLNGGALADAQSALGDTPLSYAKSWKNKKVEQILKKTINLMGKKTLTSDDILKSGGVINAKIVRGFTLLHFAAEWYDTYKVECILRRMKVTNRSAFQSLLNAKTFIYGKTPLMMAAARNSTCSAIAKLLIDYGADPKICGITGTALHFAVESANENLVELLLSKGAYYNARNFLRQTPLTIAKVINATELVTILELTERLFSAKTADEIDRILKCGRCSINARNKYGYTILHQACGLGQAQIVEYVLKYANAATIGNDLFLSDEAPTPMALAAWNGFPKIVRLLIDHGAEDPNITDPLKIAQEQEKRRIKSKILR